MGYERERLLHRCVDGPLDIANGIQGDIKGQSHSANDWLLDLLAVSDNPVPERNVIGYDLKVTRASSVARVEHNGHHGQYVSLTDDAQFDCALGDGDGVLIEGVNLWSIEELS